MYSSPMSHRVKHEVRHKTQTKKYTCGPTCLEMLCDFYDISHDPEMLEELCGAGEKHGTNNEDLVQAARSLGVNAVARENATIDDIVDALHAGHPVVVNYFNPLSKLGHFGVVKGIENDVLILADPKNGDDFQLPVDEFSSLWHSHDKTIKGWMMHLV